MERMARSSAAQGLSHNEAHTESTQTESPGNQQGSGTLAPCGEAGQSVSQQGLLGEFGSMYQ